MNEEVIKKTIIWNDEAKAIQSMLDHIYKRAESVTEKYSPSGTSDETKKEAFNYVFMSEVTAEITEISLFHDNTTATILIATSMLK